MELIGKKIDRFLFLELINQGTFGFIYYAHDARLRRDVAIKVSNPNVLRGKELLSDLMKEAQIQAHLEHANIIPIYDIFEYDDRLFIVMRLVQGENLKSLLEERGRPYHPLAALGLMRQVLRALGYAHRKGVVHQDLKPSNILVTEDFEALVLDFGIARYLQERQMVESSSIGTPAYISPEQAGGFVTDARSDIYSLGLTLYEMVTCHHPFEHAQSVMEMLDCHMEHQPRPLQHYNPSLPDQFCSVVMHALAKNSRDRFRTCEEFANALEASLSGQEMESAGQIDNRWDPRVAIVVPARVWLPDRSSYIQAYTVDLSINGAAMRLGEMPAVGDELEVEFQLPEPGAIRKVQAKAVVMWVRKQGSADTVYTGLWLGGLAESDRRFVGDLVREALLLGGSPVTGATENADTIEFADQT